MSPFSKFILDSTLTFIIIFCIVFYIFLIKSTIHKYKEVKRRFLFYLHEGYMFYLADKDRQDNVEVGTVFHMMASYGVSYRKFYKYALRYLRYNDVSFIKYDQKVFSDLRLGYKRVKGFLCFYIISGDDKEILSSCSVRLSSTPNLVFISWINNYIKDLELSEKTTTESK